MKKLHLVRAYLKRTFTLQVLKVKRPRASFCAKDDDQDGVPDSP